MMGVGIIISENTKEEVRKVTTASALRVRRQALSTQASGYRVRTHRTFSQQLLATRAHPRVRAARAGVHTVRL